MIRKKGFLRFIAIFMALEVIVNTLLPGLTFALTSGPTAPEASSFEPVDTTDMVNLSTGDLTYNIPLLEIPGPAGGYPLSLSYHAGIQPNQDASWAGLGWNINPGAINRFVNGYADDHEYVVSTDRSYWEGGKTTTYTVGVSVGVANATTVSSGLTFANDTYQGFGVGTYVGGGVGIGGGNSPFGVNGTVGVSPYGNTYASAGISVGLSHTTNQSINFAAQASAGVSTQSGLNVGLSGGVSAVGPKNDQGKSASYSLLGASISSGSGKPQLSVGGGSVSGNNSNSGRLSTSSGGFSVDVPTPVPGLNIRLGKTYQRYWIDEKLNVQTNGALYFPNNEIDSELLDNTTFDTYDILDIGLDIALHSKEEKVLGGSFPDYDQYSVTGQGIGGSIRPYHYQRDLYRQNKKVGGTYLTKNYTLDNIDKPVQFRFINDFSNRLEYDPADPVVVDGESPLNFKFDGNPVTGESGMDGYVDNQLVGSKHIEWFSNSQILGEDKSKDPYYYGFLNTTATGFSRESNTQIGGFIITNESGVSYHYSLPAYSYDEYMKSENTQEFKDKKGDTFNEINKPEKYAYTWFLTAVTGPDFVDRNNNRLADAEDWGYWVNFDYGKWTDQYLWRNPSEGKIKDLDGEFENFASGKKEIYYLDAIRTASHTAVFEKSVRKDGKSVVDERNGGFVPSVDLGEGCSVNLPVSVLGLDNIYLFSNTQLQEQEYRNLKSGGRNWDFNFGYQCSWLDCSDNCGQGYDPCCEQQDREQVKSHSSPHYGDNIIDYTDIGESLKKNALRVIELITDNSLAPSTSNSLDNEKLYQSIPETQLDGKLTLKGIRFRGKGGISLMPPTTFEYAKNFGYDKEKYDMWGFYKSDFDQSVKDEANENLARLTSDVSSLDVDAWSLSKINTALGASININYESDQYEDVILAKQQALRIKSVTDLKSGNKLALKFWEENVDLDDYFQNNNNVAVDILGSYYTPDHERLNCSCTNENYQGDLERANLPNQLFSADRAKVESIDSNTGTVIISDPELYKSLTQDTFIWDIAANNNCDVSYQCTYSIIEKWPDYITSGVISVPNKDKYGGGLRVANITIESNFDGHSSSTNYEYERGVTSYEPFGILPPLISPDYPSDSFLPRGTKIKFKQAVLKRYYNVIGIARELPGPGVIYENVRVSESRTYADGSSIKLPNTSEYVFKTYELGMVNVESSPVQSIEKNSDFSGIGFKQINTRKLALKDYSTRVGELQSITLLDENNVPISKTQNHYLYDGLDGTFEQNKNEYENLLSDNFNNQGLIEETFSNARFVRYYSGEVIPYPTDDKEIFAVDQYHLNGIVNKRETFPSVITGQTTINYKTGIQTSNRNLGFDFYSGALTKTLSTDSYGNIFISESTPAYKIYDDMGPMAINGNNMLTQSAYNMTYKMSAEGESISSVVSGAAQTWNAELPYISGATNFGKKFQGRFYFPTQSQPRARFVDVDGNFEVGNKVRFTLLGIEYYGRLTQLIGASADGNIYEFAMRKYEKSSFTDGSNVLAEKIGLPKKHQNYRWVGEDQYLDEEGLFDYANSTGEVNLEEFNNWYNDEPTLDQWVKNLEITLYDQNSHALEVVDINGHVAATKMDNQHYRVLATAANAAYNEFAFSGAELMSGNNLTETGVSRSEGVPSSTRSHTGSYSLRVPFNSSGFTYTLFENEAGLNKKYKASVWVYLPGESESAEEIDKVVLFYSQNGTTKSISPKLQKNKSKSWYLLDLIVEPEQTGNVVIACKNNTSRNVYFDDFRVSPLESSMTSYVYDNFSGELTYLLDDNNFYTRFEYDDMGRLIRTSRERLNFDFGDGKESFRADQVINETLYNYGQN